MYMHSAYSLSPSSLAPTIRTDDVYSKTEPNYRVDPVPPLRLLCIHTTVNPINNAGENTTNKKEKKKRKEKKRKEKKMWNQVSSSEREYPISAGECVRACVRCNI
ncbi:hypothetical protein K504DRAFT_461310 [Pleomassaria siparia CBS 279.74]|uniref:Uncharacterized protein n=1 Tax=Pleomassaria siparia CBS 279.74 TaxID=1314801 RepID=A0A6G1JWK1_9PLEO|nr:hypothetical protein K504DRAFT_461310 [Pleomassaria siparia CBS 279.74]